MEGQREEEKGRVGNADKSERRKEMRERERVRCRKMGSGERTREKSVCMDTGTSVKTVIELVVLKC